MIKTRSDFLDNLFKKHMQDSMQENTPDINELLEQISNKPLTFCFPKSLPPTRIEDNTDYLDILVEFAKDPLTDKSFFISEEQKNFIDNSHGPRDDVKVLLWLRFLDKIKNTPPSQIDDYELLFCLLTFLMPMRYAHRMAKYLLDEYETLEMVLRAPAHELRELLFMNNFEVLNLLDLLYAVICKCGWEADL